MGNEISLFLEVSPLYWIIAIIVIGLIIMSTVKHAVQTVTIVIILVVSFWFVSPGGKTIIETALNQDSFSKKAGCLVQSIVNVKPIFDSKAVIVQSHCISDKLKPVVQSELEKEAGRKLNQSISRQQK